MIFDNLKNLDQYTNIHPTFKYIFDYLKKTNLNSLPLGRINLEYGVYINVDESNMKTLDDLKYESHKKYIDLQIPLSKGEKIGVTQIESAGNIIESNDDKDLYFYDNKNFDSIISLSVGDFCIFFPNDLHAPLLGEGKIKKIVVKIPTNTQL